IVALVQLLAFGPAELVDDAAALDRRPGVDRLRPALHMLIFLRREEHVRAFVAAAERDPAVPRPDRDIGDRIVWPGDIVAFREALVEHVELALGFHGVAV